MFLESLIVAIAMSGSVTHPEDFSTPFTESCRPQQETSFRETYFELLPIENPNGQKIVLTALDPLITLSAAYMCICFEEAYSDIQTPISFDDLWNFVQKMAEGNTEEARRLLQPLRDSSADVRERFDQQTSARQDQFESCISTQMGSLGDIPFYSPLVIII